MANLSVTLELDNRGYITGIKASEDAIKKFGQTSQTATDQAARGMDRAAGRSEVLAGNLTRLRSLLLGAAFVSFARGALLSSERIQGLSDAIGIQTASLLRLQSAVRSAGIGNEEFNGVIIKFSKSVEEATERGSEMYKTFRELGITEEELTKLPLDKLFIRVNEELARLKGTTEGTTKSLAIFGKKAGELVPDEVVDNFRKLESEVGKFNDEAEGIKSANQTMEDFRDLISDLQYQFVSAFRPGIEAINWLIKNVPFATTALKLLLGVVVALGVASGITLLARGITAIIGGLRALPGLWTNIKQAFSIRGTEKGFFDGMFGRGPRGDAAKEAAGSIGAIAGAGVAGYGIYDSIFGTESAPTNQPSTAANDAAAEAERIMRESAKAEKAAERLASRLDNLRDKVADIARSYAQYSDELRGTNDLAVASLGLSENEIELNSKVADVRNRAADSIRDYVTIFENLKADEQGLKPIIIAQIQAIQERAQADEDSVRRSVTAVQAYKESLEKLADAAEMQNLRLANEESLQSLQEEINLVGLYGDALEDQQAIVKVTQELRSKLLGIQQEENDLIAKKDSLSKDAFQREMARLKALREEAYISAEERLKLEEELIAKRRELQQNWQLELGKQLEDLADSISPAKFAADAFGNVIKSVDNALTTFVEKGKFSFKDFVRSILRDLALAVARMMVFRAILSLFGMAGLGPLAAGGSSAMALNYTGPQFGGFAANGGKVMPGKAYMVGERGPELFMPKSIGNVIPNNQLGGMAAPSQTQVTYNINAVDAQSFRSMLARDPQYLFNVTEVGRRSSPARRLA